MAITPGKLTLHFQADQLAPYENNGGTIVAIGGEDYVVVAADTRISSGLGIVSRTQNKIFKVTQNNVLASTGCFADSLGFVELVKYKAGMYEYQHRKPISTNALSQMVSVLMYHQRFFPYYVNNLVAGLDADGRGVVCAYDTIGHFNRAMHRAVGTAGVMVTPILDIKLKGSCCQAETREPKKLSSEEAVELATQALNVAAERDVSTGDFASINIIKKEGIEERRVSLNKD